MGGFDVWWYIVSEDDGAWEIGLSEEFLIIGDDYVIVVRVEVACGIGVSCKCKVLVKGDCCGYFHNNSMTMLINECICMQIKCMISIHL